MLKYSSVSVVILYDIDEEDKTIMEMEEERSKEGATDYLLFTL